MRKVSHLISLAEKFKYKYASVDANSIKNDVINGLHNSISNASGTHNIMPFMQMLANDNATLSFDISRNDGLFNQKIDVDNLVVTPFNVSLKYQQLPEQIKSYLSPDLFTGYYNGDKVTYDNFKVTLNFAPPASPDGGNV